MYIWMISKIYSMFQSVKYIYFLLLCLFFSIHTYAEHPPQKYCDSLIEVGIKRMRAGECLASLEILTEAHTIAEKNNWQKQLFLAKNYMGANYFSVLDYGVALNYFVAAYGIAVNKLEPKYEVMALNNIAILYSKNGEFNKAKTFFTKAYNLSVKEKDSVKIGIYALNLGILAATVSDFPKARKHFDYAVKFLKKDSSLMIQLNTAIAENEMQKGNSGNAIALSKKLLSTIDKWQDNNNAITLLLVISKSYLKLRDFKLATEYAAMASKNNTNLETKKSIFEIRSDIYKQSGQLIEAIMFKDSIISIKDTLEVVRNGREFENSRVKFEMQEYKNQIALNKSTIENERKIFYAILTSLALILLIILLIMRSIFIKHKQKKLLAETNEQLVTLELEKEKSDNLLLEKQYREEQTNALLEQEKLKNEIEYKNRKLSVNALYLSRKNENIDEMLRLLSNLPEAAKDQSVRNHISFLKKDMRTDNEWESFITHFEEVNQGFLARLKNKHTDLTVNDIRFICYVFMNLSSKEIASMLSITLDACRKRKERIATKLGLADSGNLYSYLSSI